jgi:hypothetical protein
MSNGLVLGILGRYGSEAQQPFPPRIKAVGVDLSSAAREQGLEALQAAWEATAPWAPKAELQQKAELWLSKAITAAGHQGVAIEIVVVDNIPFHVHKS